MHIKLSSISIHEESHPIENEEWVVFLQRTIMEVMNGELASLMQCNLANIIVSPLRNRNASPKVLQYVANIFSVPFVVRNSATNSLDQIQKVNLSGIRVLLLINLLSSGLFRCKTNTKSGIWFEIINEKKVYELF